MKLDYDNELKQSLIQIARSADQAILKVYSTRFKVHHKHDASPVTEADHRAHDVIVEGLTRIDSRIPIVSEESALPPLQERQEWEQYWLVDPLDGTKEFVKRSGEFTVNIALISNHEPLIGVASIPVKDVTYFGDLSAQVAVRVVENQETPIRTRKMNLNDVIVMQSRRRRSTPGERFLSEIKKKAGRLQRDTCGSSIKCLRVAEGSADFYLQSGPTSEWDTAACHAILKAAGGEIFSFNQESLRYNTEESILNQPFIALGDLRSETQELIHGPFNRSLG